MNCALSKLAFVLSKKALLTKKCLFKSLKHSVIGSQHRRSKSWESKSDSRSRKDNSLKDNSLKGCHT